MPLYHPPAPPAIAQTKYVTGRYYGPFGLGNGGGPGSFTNERLILIPWWLGVPGTFDRIGELTRRANELERELAALVTAQAPALLELPGCGVLTAAKLVGETAGVERFADDARLAMHAGAAPLPASSGNRQRHRLNRSGNRQLNCALHRIAVGQGRCHPPARAYLARKEAEGKSRKEALRCLKRYLARTIYRILSTNDHTPTTIGTAPTTALALT